MAKKAFLGEFEQMVLLPVLQGGKDANAFQIRRELEASAGRSVSKGAFYTTLDRLEGKAYLTWTSRIPDAGRSGLPQRHFRVTPAGIDALRRSRAALLLLWRDLDTLLDLP